MAEPAPNKPVTDGDWTVGKIIEWTTAHLKKHGSDTPRLEAEILLAHTRKCPRIQLYVNFGEKLTDAERSVMRDLVKRRAQSEPVAYLVGHREFYGLDFRVTPAVLVPRPETETLVLEALNLVKSTAAPRILDLCTGSGCVAVAIAFHHKTAQMTATDLSPAALEITKENAAKHAVGDRIQYGEGDLFAALPQPERFDLIVSNPPYVAEREIESLPADVRNHEPLLALRAGSQGLDVISRLVAQAPQYLNPGGSLLIEFSPEQAVAVSALIEATGAFESSRLVKDPSGRTRIIVAKKNSN